MTYSSLGEKLDEERKQLDKEYEKILQEKDILKNMKGQNTYDKRKRDLNAWIKDHKKRKRLYNEKCGEFESFKQKMSYPDNLRIFLVDDTELSVSIISTSYHHDLALLRLQGQKTPFIEPAGVDGLSHGDPLYAIGSPVGLSLKNTVTSGIFSGMREFKSGPFYGSPYVQTNAQINKGNSGGPLVTEDGKVIGINTWKVFGQMVEGLGFAIPIGVALKEFETYLGHLK